MLRKLLVVAAFAILPAMTASAQFQASDWELTLSGQGRHGPDFNGTDFGVNFSLGYFFSKELELGVRQSLNYADDQGPGSVWDGTTLIALDYHFDMGRWQPYVGANFGYRWGEVHNTFEAGPEAGVKYFVNANTFIQLAVEYEFFFDNDSDASSAFSDGQFVYNLGIGFRFR
jgi:opacity protein-like surface antigen